MWEPLDFAKPQQGRALTEENMTSKPVNGRGKTHSLLSLTYNLGSHIAERAMHVRYMRKRAKA